MKNKGLLLVALLLLIAWKKKSGSTVTVEPVEPTQSNDADYLVLIRSGAKFYAMNKQTVLGVAQNTQKLDGFNTGELPMFVKVRMNNNFYYVKAGDFKLI